MQGLSVISQGNFCYKFAGLGRVHTGLFIFFHTGNAAADAAAINIVAHNAFLPGGRPPGPLPEGGIGI